MLANFAWYSIAVAMIILSKGSRWIGDKSTAFIDIVGVRGKTEIPEGSKASWNHRSTLQGSNKRPLC